VGHEGGEHMSRVAAVYLHLAILAVLALKYGADPLAHPVALVFAAFSTLVLLRAFFVKEL
jgi:hypothetical protein